MTPHNHAHPTSYFRFCFFYCYRAHRDLHSFPTRRSSDLFRGEIAPLDAVRAVQDHHAVGQRLYRTAHARERSEEHTSELQSRLHLVCRLLLEKKNESYQILAPPDTRL